MKIKVALNRDSRGISYHNSIVAAMRAKEKRGSAYHVYIQYYSLSGKPLNWDRVV